MEIYKPMRRTKPETRAEVIKIMNEIYQNAQSQADFTPEKIAEAAGISKVWFYHLVCSEFQALRAQLDGPRFSRDGELFQLRRERDELRQQLKEAQLQLRSTAIKELEEAIIEIERLEKENIHLHQQVTLLKRRLEEGGQVVVQLASPGPARSRLTLVNPIDSHPN